MSQAGQRATNADNKSDAIEKIRKNRPYPDLSETLHADSKQREDSRKVAVEDAKLIERLRLKGLDWLKCHQSAAGIRLGQWNRGVQDGLADALWLVGLCWENGLDWENGLGCRANPSTAFGFFKRAAENRFASAQYDLGLYYQNGLGGCAKDLGAAAALFRQPHNQDHSGCSI